VEAHFVDLGKGIWTIKGLMLVRVKHGVAMAERSQAAVCKYQDIRLSIQFPTIPLIFQPRTAKKSKRHLQ